MKSLLRHWLKGKPKEQLFTGMSGYDLFVGGQGIFVTGVGRSGTHFVATLFEPCNTIASYHMDDIGDAVGDSFTWYSQWYNLPISSDGFIQSRAFLIKKAERQKRVYLESNPMIAFSIKELSQNFDSKFVIMVRNPRKVVESHLIKGWYEHVIPDFNPVPGYQYNHQRPNHFFSRIMPADLDERKKWMSYSKLGKIAWMWRVTYERIFEQLKNVDPARFRVCLLDQFSYDEYFKLAQFVNSEPISAEQFRTISDSKPGKGKSRLVEWNAVDKEQFKQEIGLAVKQFQSFGFSEEWMNI